jgi:hypothetical protein
MTVYNVQNMSLDELYKTRAELWGIYQDACIEVDWTDGTNDYAMKAIWSATAKEAWADLKVVELVIRGRGGRAAMCDWQLEPETRNDPDAARAQGGDTCEACGCKLGHGWFTSVETGARYCVACFECMPVNKPWTTNE